MSTAGDASADASTSFALQGHLTLATAAETWRALQERARAVASGSRIAVDLSAVESMDGGTMALLVQLRAELAARGVRAELTGAREAVQALVHLYSGDVAPVSGKRAPHEGTLAQIGRGTIEFFLETLRILGFLGDMLLSALGVLREPKTGNWKDVVPTMERTGANAVPIVVLINFLVGFVMAFQGANQLRQFGASIFVADLVGVSITRELGPLMTAIIVCGRSGAAFAAELGSMRVSEEIDALRTMGFGPMRYLVLPRTVALVLVMPILTLLGDFVGILGGMAVGIGGLGLTFQGYLIETRKAVVLWDVSSGLVKSVVFAIAISLIACQQGFATTGGAEGVGRRTTSAVVSTLFALIVIDACFTMFFHAFNL